MSQFRIEQKISESGSTTVYRAFQETLDRPVLLKVLHQHLANDPAIRERFSREAKACAHLRSEHIVQVYDLTEYNGCPAIVMEYVHGHSLKEVIAAPVTDVDQLATKTAVSILQALSIAHRRGVVHRDIKPGNILVADDGIIKLTDFGLAHVVDSPTLTMEGTVLGTPAYMAPEQIRGERVDARTDFFSLGVTLVEVLSGQRIFEGSTYSECVKKITEFRADHLDRLTKAIPPERLGFLKRLMDPDPDKRYQSAKDALKDLGEGEEAEPTTNGGVNVSRRMLVPVVSFFAMVLIAGLIYVVIPRNEPVVQMRGMPMNPQRQDTVPVREEGRNITDHPSGIDAKVSAPPKEREQRNAENILPKNKVQRRDSSSVVFTSNPWAKVYVDGRLVGETPMANRVVLPEGKHSITFTNPSFDPIIKTVDVQAMKEQMVTADFLGHAGYLMCSVHPWAEVYVDEQYKDTTPLTKPIIVSAGTHRLRFHNGALRDSMQVVNIQPRDTLSITITLRPSR